MAFIPNNICEWSRAEGYDINAEPKFTFPRRLRCAVVSLILDDAKTSVRTDSSASRGAAEEEVAQSMILFPATAKIAKGDRVICEGVRLKISSIQPRRAVTGRLDHQEAILELWR